MELIHFFLTCGNKPPVHLWPETKGEAGIAPGLAKKGPTRSHAVEYGYRKSSLWLGNPYPSGTHLNVGAFFVTIKPT